MAFILQMAMATLIREDEEDTDHEDTNTNHANGARNGSVGALETPMPTPQFKPNERSVTEETLFGEPHERSRQSVFGLHSSSFHGPPRLPMKPPATPSGMSTASIDHLQSMMSFYVEQLMKTQQAVERLEKQQDLKLDKDHGMESTRNKHPNDEKLRSPPRNARTALPSHLSLRRERTPPIKNSNNKYSATLSHERPSKFPTKKSTVPSTANSNNRIEFLAERCRKWQLNYSQLKSDHFALQHEHKLRLNRIEKLKNLLSKQKEKYQIITDRSEDELVNLNIKWLDYEKQIRNDFNSKLLLLTIENQQLKDEGNARKLKAKTAESKMIVQLKEKLQQSLEHYASLKDLHDQSMDKCMKREAKFKDIIEILMKKLTTGLDSGSLSTTFSSEILEKENSDI